MEITPEKLLEILQDGSFYDPKNKSYDYMTNKDWIEASEYLMGCFVRAGFKIVKY